MITREFLVDAAERIVATFVEAFIGLLLASESSIIAVSTWQAAAVAAIPAVLSAAKAIIARHFGDPESASLAD